MQTLPPDPEGRNDDRAEWAHQAIEAFAEAANMRVAGEDEETILTDLLCDLRHWADRQGIAWQWTLSCADTHYEAETRA